MKVRSPAPGTPPPRPMRSQGFSDPSFVLLAALAHQLAGLVFPPNRQPSAEAGMRRAMASLRLSRPSELLAAAQLPGDARDVIMTELTVGESYFFRDAAQLDVLVKDVLERRATAPNERRPLRVWSAGCASGEEPFTVALLLRENGWTQAARIVGTDVSVRRLAAARRGLYTRWALRGVSEERVARWFTPVGTQYELHAGVRDSVRFQTLNLLDDDSCTQLASEGGCDLVLCRNVMIYFDLDTAARVAEGLLDALAPEGWLVLGASDPALGPLLPVETVVTPAGIAYRRMRGTPVGTSFLPPFRPAESSHVSVNAPMATPAAAGRVPIVDAVPPPVRATLGELIAASPHAHLESVEAVSDAVIAPASTADALVAWTRRVRAAANAGRLHEAADICARALVDDPLAAELHVLNGTLLLEADLPMEAAAAARRAVYLAPGLSVAHLLLGTALARTGDADRARTALQRCLQLLSAVDAGQPVDGADGLTSGQLIQMAKHHLRILPGTGIP